MILWTSNVERVSPEQAEAVLRLFLLRLPHTPFVATPRPDLKTQEGKNASNSAEMRYLYGRCRAKYGVEWGRG